MTVQAMPQIKGRAIRPGDPRYEEARALWNGAIIKRPALIVQCADEADAAAALAYARRAGRSVAVRGGGHNVAGTSLVEDGVVIDFSQLHSVAVEPERRRARVEPGALWGEVDAATQAHGLAMPAGIVTHTGVAGLTLGGGFGWLSRRWGLTSDHLISARLLLADGSRVVARADDHPDLFWAIRGGGGNFGIVTQFEFALHALGTTVLAGPLLHDAARAGAVLRFYRDFIAEAPDELAVFVALRRAPALTWVPEHLRGTPVAMVIPCWSGDLDRGERVLEPLRRFGPPLLDLVQRQPYTAHQRMFDAGVPHGWGYYWKSHFLPPLSDDAIAVLVAHAWRPSSPASYTLLFHLGGAIARVPRAESAYAGRDAVHAINISAVWPEGGPDHPDINWARAFFQALQPHATGGVYVNFLGSEGEERVRAAYGPHYDRLAAVKARYDPANVFRTNQNIRPRGAVVREG
jgi:FAD/FMN-containing dehydrogenase